MFNGVLKTPVQPVLLDCGASACTSPDLEAFEPESLCTLRKPIMMQGVGGGVEITMQGILSYQTLDDNGNPLTIRVPGYYAPHLKQSLFSPQILFMTSLPNASVLLSGTTAVINFSKSVSLTLQLDLQSRLFYMPTFSNVQQAADELLCNLSLTQDSNQNLSRGQKTLLRFHHALCHIGFGTIRKIGKLGWLGTKGLQLGDPTTTPIYASCQYGKGHKRNTGASTTTPTSKPEGAISKDALTRGDLVCMDHFVVTEHGRLWTSKGHEPSDKRFCGGTIFVDVASGRIELKFQISLAAADTIQSKMEYERLCQSYGFMVKSYRTDNGTFTAQSMLSHIDQKGQFLSFSGAGAQHQNGVSERAIKTICEAARTIMLHAALRWPDSYDPALWPMAMQYAADIYNEIPRGLGDITPEEIFSEFHSSHSRLLNARAWGCPTFVLEPKLREAGGKLPKWQPKTRRGQFLGFSKCHSSTVGLICNLKTGSITPQFHCVYDSEFETVGSSDGHPPSNWADLVINHRYATPLDDDADVPLHPEWLSPEDLALRNDLEKAKHSPPAPKAPPEPPPSSFEIDPFHPYMSPEGDESPPQPPLPPVPVDLIDGIHVDREKVVQEFADEPPTPTPDPDPNPTTPRRSKRIASKYKNSAAPIYKGMTLAAWCSATLLGAHSMQVPTQPDYKYMAFLLHDWDTGCVEGILPQEYFAYGSKNKQMDPDAPPWHVAMKSA